MALPDFFTVMSDMISSFVSILLLVYGWLMIAILAWTPFAVVAYCYLHGPEINDWIDRFFQQQSNRRFHVRE